MKIRRAKVSDALGIHNAHMKSIQEICSKDHSPEEIKAWGHRLYREEHRLYAIRNDLVWVVENEKTIEGYAHVRVEVKPGGKRAAIFGFYLTAVVSGHGLGKKIFNQMLNEMKAQNVKLIELESTLTAQNFYRRLGFIDTGPESKVEINGAFVRCYPMRMELQYG